MSEQSNNNSGGNQQRPQGNQGGQGQNNRRHNNRRRHNNNRPQGQGANNAEPRQHGQQGQQARPQGQQQRHPNQGQNPQGQQQGQGQGQKRRRPHNNRPRPQGGGQSQGQQHPGGVNLERIYEKYLNLLDQHIIARRKYHDLFYRAEPAQKAKLERNFYNTLNDVRDFESKLAPDVKTIFEKRNNGYQNDRTYTSNHELPIEGDVVPDDLPPAEPHLLQSQINCDYSEDTEESIGTAEDYLRYKNL